MVLVRLVFSLSIFRFWLAILLIPAWLGWNAWQIKQKKLNKYHPKLDKTVKWGLSSLLIFPIFVLLSYGEVRYFPTINQIVLIKIFSANFYSAYTPFGLW